MQLNETLAFVTVVETGSFTAAGRRLDAPKSTLSRQVSRLEARLGARLLQRTTRKLSLTETGHAYYARCKRAIEDIAEAERVAQDISGQARGHLKVSAPFDVRVAPLLPAFRARFPEITVEVVYSQDRVDLVAEGFDVALRGGALPDADFVSRRLFTDQLALCASPAYLDRRGRPRTLDDLADHDGVMIRLPPGVHALRLDGPDGPATPPLRPWFTANDWTTVREALVAELGVGLLIGHLARPAYERGTLEPVLPAYHLSGGGLYAIYPSRHHLSPKVRVFVDHLAEAMPDQLDT